MEGRRSLKRKLETPSDSLKPKSGKKRSQAEPPKHAPAVSVPNSSAQATKKARRTTAAGRKTKGSSSQGLVSNSDIPDKENKPPTKKQKTKGGETVTTEAIDAEQRPLASDLPAERQCNQVQISSDQNKAEQAGDDLNHKPARQPRRSRRISLDFTSTVLAKTPGSTSKAQVKKRLPPSALKFQAQTTMESERTALDQHTETSQVETQSAAETSKKEADFQAEQTTDAGVGTDKPLAHAVSHVSPAKSAQTPQPQPARLALFPWSKPHIEQATETEGQAVHAGTAQASQDLSIQDRQASQAHCSTVDRPSCSNIKDSNAHRPSTENAAENGPPGGGPRDSLSHAKELELHDGQQVSNDNCPLQPTSKPKRTRRSLQMPSPAKEKQTAEQKSRKLTPGGNPVTATKRRSKRLSENVDPQSDVKKNGEAAKKLPSSGRKLVQSAAKSAPAVLRERQPLTEASAQLLPDDPPKAISPAGPQDVLAARANNAVELANPPRSREGYERLPDSSPSVARGRKELPAGDRQSPPLPPRENRGCVALDPTKDPFWFDPLDPAKVHAVEAALHVSNPPQGELPLCRGPQARELSNLLDLHITNCQGGAIYVSGLPGTGKSLTVHEVARRCSGADSPGQCSTVSVNCMSLQQPAAIFSRALSGFQTIREGVTDATNFSGSSSLTKEEAVEKLREFVVQPITTPKKSRSHGMLLLILDEMDQLISQDKAVLYDLFTMPQIPRSRLILIGISNSIDMAERRLPRLREMGCHPHSVPFNSYTAPQVADIIRQRLDCLPGPVFQDFTISFCSRKIAAQSGDMRRALEACSAALSQHRQDSLPQAAPALNDDGERGKPQCSTQAAQAQLVGISHMARALSELQGGAGEESATVQTMRALPQQQQIALCAAANFLGQEPQSSAGDVAAARSAQTPPSTSKAPKSRTVSFLGNASSPAPSTPSGKMKSRLGTPSKTPGKTPSKYPWARTPARTPGSNSRAFSRPLGSQECLLGTLHDSYCQLCRQLSMAALSSLEFATACSMLADMGVIALGHAKEERLRKISLRAHKDDIILALGNVRLLKNVLSLA